MSVVPTQTLSHSSLYTDAPTIEPASTLKIWMADAFDKTQRILQAAGIKPQ